MNFIVIPSKAHTQKNKPIYKRLFSTENINAFKQSLEITDWSPVINTRDVDDSFNNFWNILNPLYKNHFPIRRTQFNKNKHKINPFMTNGLIISRNRKNELYKAALNSREQIDKVKYTLYRNMYNTLVKQSKKMHYNESLQANK
jgi:hypothetical protein